MLKDIFCNDDNGFKIFRIIGISLAQHICWTWNVVFTIVVFVMAVGVVVDLRLSTLLPVTAAFWAVADDGDVRLLVLVYSSVNNNRSEPNVVLLSPSFFL